MDLSNRIVVFFDGTRYLIASHKYDVRPMIKKLMEVYGGRGGGKAEFANYQPEKKWNVVTSSAFVLKSTRYNVFLSDSFRLIKIRENLKLHKLEV